MYIAISGNIGCGKTTLTKLLAKHYGWVCEIAEKIGTNLSKEQATAAIHEALGVKCARVLADAGVYKQTEEGRAGFVRFLNTLGYTKC